MAILVDDAIWPWRGERWAHLVSDSDVEELHAFSRDLGVRRLSFSGDHYDVTAAVRQRALALGAEPAAARELVRRLRDAGLRRRDVGRWKEWGAAPVERLGETLAPLLTARAREQFEQVAGDVVEAEPVSDARVVVRRAELVAVVVTRRPVDGRLAEGFELRVTSGDDGWFTELAADRAVGGPVA